MYPEAFEDMGLQTIPPMRRFFRIFLGLFLFVIQTFKREVVAHRPNHFAPQVPPADVGPRHWPAIKQLITICPLVGGKIRQAYTSDGSGTVRSGPKIRPWK